MSSRPARRVVMSPARALTICIAWISVGVILRFRFRIVGCDKSEGGWPLAIYFFIAAAPLMWLSLREVGYGDADGLLYRTVGRLTGLAVVVIVLSAVLPYSSNHDACST